MLCHRTLRAFLVMCTYTLHTAWTLQVRPVAHQLLTKGSLHVSSTQLDVIERRHFFQVTAASLLGSTLLPESANAGGLLQFPINEDRPLKNKYHLMRAGPSELEMEGIYSTNALFLTNRENAMHSSGEAVIKQSLDVIRQQLPTVIYHSLAANGMDTGDLIARELKFGRDRLLPEFTYLDQRGVGLWDASDESLVRPAVWAMDHEEAGIRGMDGRPPAKDDGTPNETLNDQFIRLRQFISLQESRTAGDVILIIFPDGTGPALMSCMIAGVPYKDVHALEFEPGEVRLDVTPESIKALYEARKDDPKYLEVLEKGKVQLAELRSQKTMVSLKDLREEEAQEEIELAYQRKKQADAQQEAKKKQEQEERQRQIRLEYEERVQKQKEEKERAKQEAAASKAAALKKAPATTSSSSMRPATSRTPPSKNTGLAAPSTKAKKSSAQDKEATTSSSLPMTAGVGVLGLGAIGLAVMANGGDDDETAAVTPKASVPSTPAASVPVAINSNATAPVEPAMAAELDIVESSADTVENTENDEEDEIEPPVTMEDDQGELIIAETDEEEPTAEELERSQPSEMMAPPPGALDVDDVLNQLASAEQAMKDALVEAGEKKQQEKSSAGPTKSGGLFDSPLPASKSTTVDNSLDDDDGAADWLRVLAEIRDEEEDDEEELLINGLVNGNGGAMGNRTLD